MKVFVDSSALVAILTREEDVEIVAAKLVKFESALISPIVIFAASRNCTLKILPSVYVGKYPIKPMLQ